MKNVKLMEKNRPMGVLFPDFMTFMHFMVDAAWAHGRFLGIGRSGTWAMDRRL